MEDRDDLDVWMDGVANGMLVFMEGIFRARGFAQTERGECAPGCKSWGIALSPESSMNRAFDAIGEKMQQVMDGFLEYIGPAAHQRPVTVQVLSTREGALANHALFNISVSIA